LQLPAVIARSAEQSEGDEAIQTSSKRWIASPSARNDGLIHPGSDEQVKSG
jgi:hypothetical protein